MTRDKSSNGRNGYTVLGASALDIPETPVLELPSVESSDRDRRPSSAAKEIDQDRLPASGRATVLESDDTDALTAEARAEEVRARLTPGVRIGQHFVLDRVIGTGGMGVVYRAWQDDLERWVAIKFMATGRNASGFEATIFKNEVRTMARCPHANVVPIHSTGNFEGVPYFVMDLVEGQSLQEWVTEHDVFDAARYEAAVGILLQLCDAVCHLHENELVHRDIKPTNILLKKGNVVQLTDFGVARHQDGMGFKGYVVGSPEYMAPEVFFGDADPVTEHLRDVYALGCVAFEVLTGTCAFRADSAAELCRKHMLEVPERATKLRAELPVAFDAVLARALTKDVRERTPSVEAFRAELLDAYRTGLDPERILVLDDDNDWADLISSMLKKRFRNARVDVIAHPLEALLAVDMETYSLIIADLQMPALSGLDWTRKVRATRRGRDLPIVIVTGSGGAADWKEASELGVAAVLLKPINGADLIHIVSRVVSDTRESGKYAVVTESAADA